MPSFISAVRRLLSSLLVLTALPAVQAAAKNLTQITNFGPKPTNVSFYLYCHGSAQDAFFGTTFATLVDDYSYIMIFPDSPNLVDKCWDVSSNETLTHNGGRDSLGIVSMVKWTLENYHADPLRVLTMGTSCGGMMTNVLIGACPDVFAAGNAWAGVAFGCFAGDGYDVWNSKCADGLIIKTGAEWKAIVEAAYPGYRGFRPKMQVFGGTADAVLNPQNVKEEIKEWTTLLGLPSKPLFNESNIPDPTWTTMVFGESFTATIAPKQ